MSARAMVLVFACLAACNGAPPTPPSQPNIEPSELPPKVPQASTVGTTRLARLQNGVIATVLKHRTGNVAQIQIGLLAGSDSQGHKLVRPAPGIEEAGGRPAGSACWPARILNWMWWCGRHRV